VLSISTNADARGPTLIACSTILSIKCEAVSHGPSALATCNIKNMQYLATQLSTSTIILTIILPIFCCCSCSNTEEPKRSVIEPTAVCASTVKQQFSRGIHSEL